MRVVSGLVLLTFLTACNAKLLGGVPPPTDLALGAGALALIYSEEVGEIADEASAEAALKNAELEKSKPPRLKATTTRIANHVRASAQATKKHLNKWWTHDPNAVQPPLPVPDSYCYRTQGDVLCYRAPMPGWETRLIGYQGTTAEAPPPAVMQPLPIKSNSVAMLPANRVANAKPVFVTMPPDVKEEPKSTAEPSLEDVQHDTITADPALAPQL